MTNFWWIPLLPLIGFVCVAAVVAGVLRCRRKPKPQPVVQTFERVKLEARLRGMASDDPLWPQLLALLDATVATETSALVQHGLDDTEVNRLRGRVGMLVDLKSELQGAWERTHVVEESQRM